MITRSVNKAWVEEEECNKLHRIINQFVTSCSHSMRGPLKSIEGLVNILQDNFSKDKNESTLVLSLIKTNLYKMEHMLDELEHFLENSRRKIANMSTNIKEIIEETAENFNEVLKNRDIKLFVDVIQNEPLLSDPNRLRLILRNLIDNAIRFHHNRKEDKWISVKASVTSKYLYLNILDNGVGIPREFFSQTSRPFFRGSSASSGFGMGLYLVNEILLKMNGRISISSSHSGSSIEMRIINPIGKTGKVKNSNKSLDQFSN